MFIIMLLRFLSGYVVFEARNGFPERFVNLCTNKRIPLWEMKNHGDVLVARTTVKGYKAINSAAQNSGMTTRIIKKTGLPFFLSKNRKRKGIALGVLVCLLIITFMSTMVWTVSVTGNESYTDEEILSLFSEYGVNVGVFKRSIDVRSVCEQAVKELDNVSWAMVNIRGCAATVEIREGTEKPEIVDNDKPVNIVASCDGQIMRYEVYAGVPVTKSGNAVTKGELLVDSVIENKDKSERFVHARALITARTEQKITEDSPCRLLSLTQEKNKNTVFFFGIKIPLGFLKDDSGYFKYEQYLQSGKKRLPVGIIRERTANYETETTQNELQQNLLLTESFNLKEIELFTMSEKVLSSTVTKGGNIISGKYVCETQIAAEQEIIVEN